MTKIDLHQVDAFTTQLFGGNPAGIVTNADELSEQNMQNIAREMNLSETAFVCPPTTHDATVKVRFFTRSGDEVPFCGHATVGTLAQLAKLDLFGLGQPGTQTVRVETGIGVLDMQVVNDDTTEVVFAAPPVALEPYKLQGKEFADKLGVPAKLVHSTATIFRDTTLNYLYIPVVSLQALGEQTFDSNRIREQFRVENTIVFCLYTPETFGAADLHARSLAPNIGIDEDPFTGSMQAGLVVAAKENNLINTAQTTVATEQGHFVDRPGSAVIRQTADNTMTVSASAVPVFSTTMEV